MAEMRASIKSIKAKPGSTNDPSASYEVVLSTRSMEAAAELLGFVGRDVVASLEPLDRQLFAMQADEAQANGTNGTAPEEEAAPRRRSRRGRATADPVEAAAGP
jgi:hypothetical protein